MVRNMESKMIQKIAYNECAAQLETETHMINNAEIRTREVGTLWIQENIGSHNSKI